MATETPVRRSKLPTPPSRVANAPTGAVFAVLAAAASVGLAFVGRLQLVAVGVILLAFVGIAAVAAWRSFVQFVCAAIILRPLLDLTAKPRNEGLIGVTEVFGMVVVVVCLAWLWANRAALKTRTLSLTAIALGGLLVTMVLSGIGSINPAGAVAPVLRVSAGFAILISVDLLLYLKRLSFRGLINTLGASCVIPLLFPFLEPLGVTVTHQKDGVTALKSVFYLSNNFGHFLVPLIAVSGALLMAGSKRVKLPALAVFGLAMLELAGTETRGAWIAAFASIAVCAALLNRRYVVGVFVGVVVAFLFVPQVHDRVTSLIPNPDDPRHESSLAWRFNQWGTLLPLAATSPVVGVGPEQSVSYTGKQPHNDYVRALVETGLVGLTFYLMFMFTIFGAGVRIVRRVGGTPLDRLYAARGPNAPPRMVDRNARALLVATAAYTVGVMLASAGENLIDNVTFLWSAMPLFALTRWSLTAHQDELTLWPELLDDADRPAAEQMALAARA